VLFGAAAATPVLSGFMDYEIAFFIGAMVGLLTAAAIGGLIFGVLMCEIVRKEIRNSLHSLHSAEGLGIISSYTRC
jgi:hypothetical protein